MNNHQEVTSDQLEARIAELTAALHQKEQAYQAVVFERDKANLLSDLALTLGQALDIDTIISIAMSFAPRFGAMGGAIHLLSITGDVFIYETYPKQDHPNDLQLQTLVQQTLSEGFEAGVLETKQAALISDTLTDERWFPPEQSEQNGQENAVRSLICAPIFIEQGRLRGTLTFTHPTPEFFANQDITLIETFAAQISLALDNVLRLTDLQNNLYATQLIVDISQQLVAATTLEQVYATLILGIINTGVQRSAFYVCDELDSNNLPLYGERVYVGDIDSDVYQTEKELRFPIAQYPVLDQMVQSQTPLVIEDIQSEATLTAIDREYLARFNAQSLAIIPLLTRSRVAAFLLIEYRYPHIFDEQEMALYYSLGNQAVVAIANVQQRQQTEAALAETQTLYRAGRVLAGASNLEQILQESLIEFLYSLGLDQGGITLLSPDRQQGELVTYVQDGMVYDIDKLQFKIAKDIPYQQLLLSGQPFTSYDVANDPRLEDYENFNTERPVKSLLEAPMIIQGATIGWVGADSIREYRNFSQREIDLARAMADQIAITIQNRRLLEKSERQAEQLKAVARVGNAVSQMIDLDELLRSTVDLIRDQFGFYHVSIFLLDETRKWAVVRASTGDVGEIMVKRPHQLEVEDNSIVGYVTGNAKPRIASDVGEDRVHFDNPLLPNTRSEMALPMISRGQIIGALDVQSTEAEAFSEDDIETLQVMTDQLTVALENARLFEVTQHRLEEQAAIYNIGTKIGATLDLQEAAASLVQETASVLNVAECALTVINNDEAYTINDYVRPGSMFESDKGERFATDTFQSLVTVLETKEEVICYLDTLSEDSWEYEYLTQHNGTAMVIVPVLLRGEAIAVLEVYDDAEGRRFKQENISLLDSIALQAANAIENARLFENAYKSEQYTARSLARTQSLYRISDTLATASDVQTAAETVLGEFLHLLDLHQGSLMLFDRPTHQLKTQARYINGKSTPSNFSLSIEDDLVYQHLQRNPKPLVIEDAKNHPLLQGNRQAHKPSDVQTILFIPLTVQNQVQGLLAADVITLDYSFSQEDIEMVAAIADQLSLRLESWQLLEEAQYRSNLLQTAAEVSGAAGSILDLTQLIDTSVNLIKDKFDLYYVGLFMVDEAREWAVLRAGTGEAGRKQIEAKHKLRIGEGSMIGTSVHLKEARVALDVGTETEFFRNQYLPDTHSELALPLVSQGEAIGALTVQSVRRRAFSKEDVTVLQTMADQLANVMANANLYQSVTQARRQAEARLQESVAMQKFSRDLAATRHVNEILERFFQACTDVIGFDYARICLVQEGGIQGIAGVGFTDQSLYHIRSEVDDNDIMAFTIQTGRTEIIYGPDERLNQAFYEQTDHTTWARVFTPIVLLQNVVGLVEAGINQVAEARLGEGQIRLLQSFVDQTALALDNAQSYQISQRTARREAVIREISNKIRGAITVDEILQTTLTELGQLLGSERGAIRLTTQSEALENHNSTQKGS